MKTIAILVCILFLGATIAAAGGIEASNGALIVTRDLTVAEDAFYVDSTNKLAGIGTKYPQAPLDIKKDVQQVFITNSAEGGSTWRIMSTANSWASGGGKLAIGTSADSSAETLYITGDGKVGIGTHLPSKDLDIDGDLRIRNQVSCNKLYTDASGNILCGTDGGITEELDPTVIDSVKDGIAWAEVAGIPANLDTDATNDITTANIGTQSVAYATTSGSANSVAWANVGSKPANLDIDSTNDITTANIGSQSVAYAATAGGVSWANVGSKPANLDIDSTNDITTANIGTQSVAYATTSGSANSVSWANVGSKPANLDTDSTNDITTGNIGSQNVDKVDGFDLNQDVRTTASPSFAGMTVSGNLRVTNQLLLDSGQIIPTAAVSIRGDSLPELDNSFNVGSASKRWKDASFGGAVSAGSFSGSGAGLTGTANSLTAGDSNKLI